MVRVNFVGTVSVSTHYCLILSMEYLRIAVLKYTWHALQTSHQVNFCRMLVVQRLILIAFLVFFCCSEGTDASDAAVPVQRDCSDM